MSNDPQQNPVLSREAVGALLSSALWARMLGMLGVIASIIIIATSIFKWGDGVDVSSLLIFSIVVGVVILVPSMLLFRYAGKANLAAINGRTDQFDEAFNALKGFLVMCSIMGMILLIVFLIITNIQWGRHD